MAVDDVCERTRRLVRHGETVSIVESVRVVSRRSEGALGDVIRGREIPSKKIPKKIRATPRSRVDGGLVPPSSRVSTVTPRSQAIVCASLGRRDRVAPRDRRERV